MTGEINRKKKIWREVKGVGRRKFETWIKNSPMMCEGLDVKQRHRCFFIYF